MVRKILPEQSLAVASATTVFIPAGSRILSVKGEADGKPTYDFIITSHIWSPSGNQDVPLSVKYAGTPNGRAVNLWREWPHHVNSNAVTVALGDDSLSVTPGTGVVLQVYYAAGNVTV